MALIPGQATKIPHAMQCGQNKHKSKRKTFSKMLGLKFRRTLLENNVQTPGVE